MLMILRGGLVFAVIAAAIYCLIYLATMTRFFDKARRKRILRRTLFGLVSVAIAGLVFGLIITLLN